MKLTYEMKGMGQFIRQSKFSLKLVILILRNKVLFQLVCINSLTRERETEREIKYQFCFFFCIRNNKEKKNDERKNSILFLIHLN